MSTASTPNISAGQVRELRDKTGAPMMDCKNALVAANGDLEKAVEWLRKRGVAVAEKKSSRTTKEGAVESYIHAGGKIGVLVEVNCESDFVARTEDFKELIHDIAMHIAASDPKFVPRPLKRKRTSIAPRPPLPASPPTWSRRSWKARWPSSTRKSA
jgi:elongation factor Ts